MSKSARDSATNMITDRPRDVSQSIVWDKQNDDLLPEEKYKNKVRKIIWNEVLSSILMNTMQAFYCTLHSQLQPMRGQAVITCLSPWRGDHCE